MCANDDVVYLYTISRSEGPPTSVTDTSSIDSNNTIRRVPQQYQSRAKQASCLRRHRSSRGKRHKPEIRIGKAKPKWTVPLEIRNKCVRMGWTLKDISGEHRSVFGVFDGAGRFCRRIGVDSPSSESIEHRAIKYYERFSGLSPIEVRSKVLQLLMAKYGATLGPGEM